MERGNDALQSVARNVSTLNMGARSAGRNPASLVFIVRCPDVLVITGRFFHRRRWLRAGCPRL